MPAQPFLLALCILFCRFNFLVYIHFLEKCLVYIDFKNIFSVYKAKPVCYNQAMKVTRNLEITAAEFFSAVLDELAAEIRAADKTAAVPEALHTGFTYIYQPDDSALRISFEIAEYQEDRLYKAVRTSAGSTLTIIYEVTPTDKGISVTFTYDDGTPKKTGLFSIFSETIILSRMTDKLYGLQRAVINKKEGFTEQKSNNLFMPDIRKSK